uniref:Uncharacterized protein n=1 Tax=Rhipicephalus microplus TaxID=6941 RepID=A0A6G5A0Q4_RHIMP
MAVLCPRNDLVSGSSRVFAFCNRIILRWLLTLANPLGAPQLVGSDQVPARDSTAAAIAVDARAVQGVASTLGTIERSLFLSPAHSTREAAVVEALEALQCDGIGLLYQKLLLCQVLYAVPAVILLPAASHRVVRQCHQHGV